MKTIALISEGVTDHAYLEYLIKKSAVDNFEINYIQPTIDNTDRHYAAHAGWTEVFSACEKMAQEALYANDYLVVQIDTDCGDNSAFGVPLTTNGKDRTECDIAKDTILLLIKKIGPKIFCKNRDRIIFCICVHSIESWILYTNYNIDKIKNSENKLKSEIYRLNEDKFEKTFERYKAFGKKLKTKDLKNINRSKGTLGYFLEKIDNM